jgi:hypothetical protein
MSEITFSFQGRQVTAEEFAAITAKPKKRASKAGPDAYHRGFRVVGHKPGAVKAAEEFREDEIRRYRNTTPKQRVECGMKEPKPWDEAWWRANAPKATIKTVDLSSAADEAAELARRYGWTEVSIVALTKGEKPQGWA